MQFPPYKRKEDLSYALGFYPTIELLETHRENVLALLVSSRIRPDTLSDLKQRAPGIPIVQNDKPIKRLTDKENCCVAGVFHKYPTTLEKDRNHVILYQPQDMGNLGTIMRTIHAFGIPNLCIISPGADAFHPKTIRASMGSVFSLNVESIESIARYTETHTNTLYCFDAKGKLKLRDTTFLAPYSLVFGNEAAGIPQEEISTHTTVSIPQLGNVDSINIAVSVGIGLYEATNV